MFRSVFGRADPGQQTQAAPSADGAAASMASTNPLSRQPSDMAYPYPMQAASPPSASSTPQPPAGVPRHPSPAGRKHFPELANLSAEECRVLLTDPEAYHKFLHRIEEVSQLDSVVEDLQKSNLDLAKSTLAMEGTISELQNQCRIIRGTELAAAREQLQQQLARQQQVIATLGPQALIAKVQGGAEAVSRDSEALQAQLVAGDIPLSTFLKEYRAKRKVHHTRNQTALAAQVSLPLAFSR